jgi:hypothetical protein
VSYFLLYVRRIGKLSVIMLRVFTKFGGQYYTGTDEGKHGGLPYGIIITFSFYGLAGVTDPFRIGRVRVDGIADSLRGHPGPDGGRQLMD